MLTKSPKTYWLGCFPNHFYTEIGVDDAKFFGANLDYVCEPIEALSKRSSARSAQRCYVTIDRIGARGSALATVQRKLRHLLAIAPTESWLASHFDYVAFIWEGAARRGDAAGFAIFPCERIRLRPVESPK